MLTSGHPPEIRSRVLTSGHPPGTQKHKEYTGADYRAAKLDWIGLDCLRGNVEDDGVFMYKYCMYCTAHPLAIPEARSVNSSFKLKLLQ